MNKRLPRLFLFYYSSFFGHDFGKKWLIGVRYKTLTVDKTGGKAGRL